MILITSRSLEASTVSYFMLKFVKKKYEKIFFFFKPVYNR